MILKARSTVTDAVIITATPAGPVHALELWDAAALAPLAALLGFALPPPGQTAGGPPLRAIRTEPAVWLLDGARLDPAAIAVAVGDYGALTPVGGGLLRIRLTGPGWRAALMANGLFDAEDPAFVPGCTAATLIAHVGVRLIVTAADACDVLVAASYAVHLRHALERSAKML